MDVLPMVRLRLYYGTAMCENVYYCPRCDKTIPKERVDKTDRELKEKFGVSGLSDLRCPVCDCEYIDLDKVTKGGEEHVGKTKKGAPIP